MEEEKVLWHVVLISFRPHILESVRQEIYDSYQRIAKECGSEEAGILFFNVEKNLDPRKNIHLVEIAVFRDNAALQAFRTHPRHTQLTNVLKEIADWWVGDINGDDSLFAITT